MTRTAPAFVEVVPAAVGPIGVSECMIDFADARGATMRDDADHPEEAGRPGGAEAGLPAVPGMIQITPRTGAPGTTRWASRRHAL